METFLIRHTTHGTTFALQTFARLTSVTHASTQNRNKKTTKELEFGGHGLHTDIDSIGLNRCSKTKPINYRDYIKQRFHGARNPRAPRANPQSSLAYARIRTSERCTSSDTQYGKRRQQSWNPGPWDAQPVVAGVSWHPDFRHRFNGLVEQESICLQLTADIRYDENQTKS